MGKKTHNFHDEKYGKCPQGLGWSHALEIDFGFCVAMVFQVMRALSTQVAAELCLEEEVGLRFLCLSDGV